MPNRVIWFCRAAVISLLQIGGGSVPLVAQENAAIDDILMVHEFKAEEQDQLVKMPMSSVAELTKRLRAEASDNLRAQRLFEFLVFKVKQFDGELPAETRNAAMAALEEKAGFNAERRQRLLRTLDEKPPAAPGHHDAKVKKAPFPLGRIGVIVSLLAVVTGLGLLLRKRLGRRRDKDGITNA